MVALSAQMALFQKVKVLLMQTSVNATSSLKWWIIYAILPVKFPAYFFLKKQLKESMDEGDTEEDEDEDEEYIFDSPSSHGD